MTDDIISKELPVLAMSRSGAKKLIQLLQELEICSYWGNLNWMFNEKGGKLYPTEQAMAFLGRHVPRLHTSEGLSFREPVGVKVSHVYQHDDLRYPFARLVRDPRDAAISNFESLCSGNSTFTPECLLDQPLVPSQGGLWGLGMVEEWFLQEKMISLCADTVVYLYFELIESLDIEMVSGFLAVLNVERKTEEIERALQNSLAINFKKNKEGENRVARWKAGKYPKINERAELISAIVTTPHNYFGREIPSSTQAVETWGEEEFVKLLKIFLERSVSNIGASFPSSNIGLMIEPLSKLASFIDHLPLLQLRFAQIALVHAPELITSAGRVLKNLCSSESAYIRIVASIELLRMGQSDINYEQVIRDSLSQIRGTRNSDELLQISGLKDTLSKN